jgi:hypothetical protein
MTIYKVPVNAFVNDELIAARACKVTGKTFISIEADALTLLADRIRCIPCFDTAQEAAEVLAILVTLLTRCGKVITLADVMALTH